MIKYSVDWFSLYTLFKTRLVDFLFLHVQTPVDSVGIKMQLSTL